MKKRKYVWRWVLVIEDRTKARAEPAAIYRTKAEADDEAKAIMEDSLANLVEEVRDEVKLLLEKGDVDGAIEAWNDEAAEMGSAGSWIFIDEVKEYRPRRSSG